MRLSHLVIGCYLISTAGLASLPSTAVAQSRPTLDPKIPAYIPQQSASGTLSISGSAIVKPLVQAWVNDLMRRHPRLKITLAADGSETGLAALLAHRTGMAAISRRLTASEIAEFVGEYGYEPTEVPVAGDALAIFVNKDNPVTGLSLDELDAMFCRERRRGLGYVIDSWGLVGVMDEWFEAPVQLYGRNGKSGLGYFFREEVCKDGTFHPQLVDADGSASVVLDVGRDQHGIGFSAISYGTSMVRPVPIALSFIPPVEQTHFADPSDQASNEFEQNLSYQVRMRVIMKLKRIERALLLLRTKNYGYCRRCRKAIPDERLVVQPDTLFCVPCLALAERRASRN
ncbi:MAG: substrate-binding domain-containing protein [Nitrospira sp.]